MEFSVSKQQPLRRQFWRISTEGGHDHAQWYPVVVVVTARGSAISKGAWRYRMRFRS